MYLYLALILDANQCMATSIGTTFLFVLLTEMLVSLFVKTVLPFLVTRFWKNGERTLEFDVSEEILQIFYRQYIVQLCSFVSPWAGLVGFVTFVCEFGIDVFRIKKVCKDPGLTVGDMRAFIGLLFLFVSIMTFLSYPNGFLWMAILPQSLPNSYRVCFL